MTSLLSRVFAAVRAWIGLNDPAENRLHASHGWLLPPPGARPLAVAQEIPLAPVAALGRRR